MRHERYRPDGPHGHFQQPRTDNIHLLRNLPFEYYVQAWSKLPPATEVKQELAYIELVDAVAKVVYKVVFQVRNASDALGNKRPSWFIYQIERLG